MHLKHFSTQKVLSKQISFEFFFVCYVQYLYRISEVKPVTNHAMLDMYRATFSITCMRLNLVYIHRAVLGMSVHQRIFMDKEFTAAAFVFT